MPAGVEPHVKLGIENNWHAMSEIGQTSEETIFSAALLRAPSERAAYLDQACAGDTALRQRVQDLLEAQPQLGSFMEDPLDRVDCGSHETLRVALATEEGPGTRIGRYKLLQKLGEGGCGVVYMAEQEEPVRRRVALKIIKLGMDTKQVIARFEAERQALALMDHPNIAKVLDAGATEIGRPFFVMELVRGIKITEFCDQNRLSTRERLNLFIQVCQAVQHAHQKGIIHRDLKPSNILVAICNPGSPGIPMIIDFGIAKATQGRLTDQTLFTAFEQFIGTPAYMSPEQALMTLLDVDTRSDIYSLGVLLYELLTGSTPFNSKELLEAGFEEMRRTICEKEPMRPSTRLSTLIAAEQTTAASFRATEPPKLIHLVRGDLDWIVMKCLEKDRARRYETANGLAADIERYLSNEPISARPPSRLYRFQKAWRRNQAIYSAGLAGAVALVLGTVTSLWQARQATRASQAEHQARVSLDQERRNALANLHEARRIAYMADMRIVQESINNNLRLARQILNDHRHRPGEEDLRDWEWFYFERLARTDDGEEIGKVPGGARFLLTATNGLFVAFGSTRIVDAKLHGRIWIGDSERRQVLTSIPAPSDTTAVALARDGTRLAVARGLSIEIRPTAAPASVLNVLTNWHQKLSGGQVGQISFVENDTRLAVCGGSASPDVPFSLVDIQADVSTPVAGLKSAGRVYSLAPSKGGNLLAVNLNGNQVVILDLPKGASGAQFRISDTPARRGITPLAFVDEDQSLLTASDSGRLDLWEVKTGRFIRMVGEHTSSVTSLAVSPDGIRFASSSLDQLIKLWDIHADGSPPRVLRGHEDEVWGVGFAPSGSSLVSSSRDESLRSWDLRLPIRAEGKWAAPQGLTLAALRFGILGATESSGLWTLWDISSIPDPIEPRTLARPPAFDNATVIPLPRTEYRVVVHAAPGGSGLPTFLYRGTNQPRLVAGFPEFELSPTAGTPCVHFSQQNLMLHGSVKGVPHFLVWNIRGEHAAHAIKTTIAAPRAVAIAPDDSWALLGDSEGALETVDFKSDSTEYWPAFLPGSVSALAIMRDNRTVFAASWPGVLRKIDVQTREFNEVPGSLLNIQAMSVSPSGSRLATGDAQGVLRLWDTKTLRDIAVLGTHAGPIIDVCFQPDGRTLLSIDATELRAWQVGSDEDKRWTRISKPAQ
jgi:eukaryotic-like serine/threonine-protein kinase